MEGNRAGLRPGWLILAASAAFATASPLSRLARPAHPVAIACGRVWLAALLLTALDPAGLWRSVRALDAVRRARVFLAGALLAAHFALFQWGLDRTSLAAAVSLVSLEPLSVVLFAWLFFRIEPRRVEKIGVLVATLGAVVVGSAAGEGEHSAAGDLFVLGAVVLFGLYVSSARSLREELPAMHYAPLVYAAAGLCLSAILPLLPAGGGQIWPLPAASLGAIVALALLPTTVGHTLVQAGARTLSPSVVALVCPGETLGSILISAFAFGKTPSAAEAGGGALILAGALIAMLTQGAGPARDGGAEHGGG